MKTDNLEKILCSIDKKTLGSVVDERYKRTETTEAENRKTVLYTEKRRPLGNRIMKIASIAASFALAAAVAVVCFIQVNDRNHTKDPADQSALVSVSDKDVLSRDTSESDSYVIKKNLLKNVELPADFFDNTRKVSEEDALSVEPGMTLGQIIDILGKPHDGILWIRLSWLTNDSHVSINFDCEDTPDVFDLYTSPTAKKIVIQQVLSDDKVIKDIEPEPADEYFGAFTNEELFNADQNAKINRSAAEGIRSGMTYEQVVGILGKPLHNQVTGEYWMVWDIDDGDSDLDYIAVIRFTGRDAEGLMPTVNGVSIGLTKQSQLDLAMR